MIIIIIYNFQKTSQPAETRPRSNFLESRVAFSKVRSAKLNTDVTISMPSTDYFGETALKQDITYLLTPCGNHTITHFRSTDNATTTTHNLLTFNISEISQNSSEKLSLLANKHLWTFLSNSPYASSQMQSHALAGNTLELIFTRKKSLKFQRALVELNHRPVFVQTN